MKRGFLFDFDGTLVDSMSVWSQVERNVVSLCGCEMDGQDRCVFFGSPVVEVAAHFGTKYGVDSQEILHLVDEEPFEFYNTAVSSKPGVKQFIYEASRIGIPCAVISAAPHRFLEAGLNRVGIRRYFDPVISVNDVMMSKMSPTIYRYVCSRMGIDVQASWSFDDSPLALDAQRQSGLRTGGVLDVVHGLTRDEYARHCDVVIESYDEVTPQALLGL